MGRNVFYAISVNYLYRDRVSGRVTDRVRVSQNTAVISTNLIDYRHVRQVRCTFDIRYSAMERRTRLHVIFVAHAIFRLHVHISTTYVPA